MLNQVQLIGNVRTKPEIRKTRAGDKVASFTLATSERWRSNGERKERTEWHRVVVWGKLASVIEAHVVKGSTLFLCGAIRTRRWTDQDGTERCTAEIVLSGPDAKVLLLGDPRGVDNEDDADDFRENGAGQRIGGVPRIASSPPANRDEILF